MAVSHKRGSATPKARATPTRERQPSDARANQRRRTKEAIMAAVREMLVRGQIPSIADAAEAAGVSRATAYRYFPTQGALVRNAVDAVLVRADEWDERLRGHDELTDRAKALSSEMYELVRDNEALMRATLLLSLQQWAKVQAGEDLGEKPIQRGGRLAGVKATLEPFEDDLDPGTLRRLAIALSLMIGVEARVVLRDIWHLEEDEAEATMLWMVRVVAKAALAEAGSARLRTRAVRRSEAARPARP